MTARVLVVDDIMSNVKLLEAKLTAEYFDVVTAFNGLECLARMAENVPDIVLLDLGLPGMNGYEVARTIRSQPEFGTPLLVAVTGWNAPDERLRTKEAGFDEHLTKLVDISMIELLLTHLPERPVGGNNPPISEDQTIVISR